MVNGLHIIKYPVGTYGFVGRVPAVLAFTSQHPEDLAAAAQCGAGLARKIAERNGRAFETRSWAAEAEARAAAAAEGYQVT